MGVLAGKGAVVTGGSRGIGRAIVQRLAAEGATVVFNFVRSADQAAEVEQAVRDAGGRAHAVQIDEDGRDRPGSSHGWWRSACQARCQGNRWM